MAPEVIANAAEFGLACDPWQCFVLEHGLGQTLDERWTSTRVGCWVPRQNGKGAIIEALILYWLFHGVDLEVVYSAHQDITAAKMWKRACRLVMSNPEYHDLVLGAAYDATGRPDLDKTTGYRARPGERAIELADGRKCEFATRSGSRMRGFTNGKLIFDEAQELDAEQMAALLPTLSAITGQQSWFFGTPPTDPAAWCYGLKGDGEAGDTPRLAWFDWGLEWVDVNTAEGRAMVMDPATWYATNPALGIRIELETVEDEARPSGLGDKFPQERLGMWQPLAIGSGVISKDKWESRARTDAPLPKELAVAAVVNAKRTRTAVAVAGPLESGEILVDVQYEPGTWWFGDRLAKLKAKRKPVAIALGRGPTEATLPDLKKLGLVPPEDEAERVRGQLVVPAAADVVAAFGQFLDHVNQDRLVHRSRSSLNTSVRVTGIRMGGSGPIWDYRGDESAPVEAATLALWTWIMFNEVVKTTYSAVDNIW